MKHGKHYVDAAKLVDSTKAYDVNEALELACKTASAKFDETVELHVRLGVDGRHADQQVRGAVVLPNGTGKTVRVCAIAKGAAAAAAAKAAAEAAAAQKVNTLSPTSIIFYDYSMSKLTPKEKTRLELMADLIKSGPKDRVYKIEGHADQQTGTAAGNKRVAEHRAKRVYDFLVSKGVNPKQLNYEGKGNSPDPFKKVQAANRAAIIQ